MVTHWVFHVWQLERVPYLFVGVRLEGIKIVADRADEEDGLLWNHGQARAKVVQVHFLRVHAVDDDLAVVDVAQAEERDTQWRLSCF